MRCLPLTFRTLVSDRSGTKSRRTTLEKGCVAAAGHHGGRDGGDPCAVDAFSSRTRLSRRIGRAVYCRRTEVRLETESKKVHRRKIRLVARKAGCQRVFGRRSRSQQSNLLTGLSGPSYRPSEKALSDTISTATNRAKRHVQIDFCTPRRLSGLFRLKP
jgi:hypothetical protein